MRHIDLRTFTAGECQATVDRLLREEARQPFALSSGPLVRATAIRVAEQETVLSVTMHHIVSDGWSIDLFLNELTRFYADESVGITPAPEPLPLQYADFAAWQRARFDTGEIALQVEYWQETMAGIPAVLDLPLDRPRPEAQSYLGATYTTIIDAPLAALLAQRSRELGVTSFMMLLAVFSLVLGRCSGQDDVVIGFPAAGRDRSELESLIGMFVNTVPIRLRTTGHATFEELLAHVRTRTLDALANQDVPFEKLVEALGVERSLAWSPLFQAMFVMQHAQALRNLPAGISAEAIPAPAQESTKFDLTLAIAENGDHFSAAFEYDRALFDQSTIETIAADYLQVLQSVLEAPSSRVDTLTHPAGTRPRTPDVSIRRADAPGDATTPAGRDTGTVEQALADIWREVLALGAVEATDNFFELGGDSIVSIRVIAKLRERGWRIQPKDIFRHQTIRALAAVAQPIEALREAPEETVGRLPLTPMQQLFFSLNPPTPNHFNQSLLLVLDAGATPDHLEAALREMQRVHPALRSRFHGEGEGHTRWQTIETGADVFLERHDLSTVAAADRTAQLEQICNQAQRRLNITVGPLFRALYFRLDQHSSRLFLVAHHLVVDAVSWRVILADIESAYRQIQRWRAARARGGGLRPRCAPAPARDAGRSRQRRRAHRRRNLRCAAGTDAGCARAARRRRSPERSPKPTPARC